MSDELTNLRRVVAAVEPAAYHGLIRGRFDPGRGFRGDGIGHAWLDSWFLTNTPIAARWGQRAVDAAPRSWEVACVGDEPAAIAAVFGLAGSDARAVFGLGLAQADVLEALDRLALRLNIFAIDDDDEADEEWENDHD